MTNPASIGDIEVGGITRGAFLVRTALTAGALYGAGAAGPALTRALGHGANGAFSGGDVGIVNFALTLEKIEADFYKRALAVKGLKPGLTKLLQSIALNETEHVNALTQSLQLLGAKPGPPPKTKLPALKTQADVLRVAIQLEDTGVSAYNGAATQIQSADLLQVAASIAQVEGRHAGALREFAGQFPSAGPFDKVLSGAQADAAAHRLGA
jgi:rubrerythrin